MLAARETTDFLRQSLERDGSRVETIETHASLVFIGRDLVRKLKRPVHYPYLDFSTPEKRLEACRAEYNLNRRTAPNLYLGVKTIVRDRGGSLVFDGDGELIDAIVEMRRFEQSQLFDALAKQGRLSQPIIGDLAARIAQFHRDAAIARDPRGSRRVQDVLAINARSLRTTDIFSPSRCDDIDARFQRVLETQSALLDQRGRDDKIRHCHGDLTLRNICMFEGEPTPFDCLEFDVDLATTDVLYDLAFPLMDLWHRGEPGLANFCFNRYLDARDEIDGVALLPLFMAMRACVRAHVAAAQARDAAATKDALGDEARAYLSLAGTFLDGRPAALIAIGGLSGSGKSTLAAGLANEVGAAPGARVVSSDRARKRLFGVGATTRLSAEAYQPDVSQRVYDALRADCARILDAGGSCIVEAVFDRPEDRDALDEIGRAHKVALHGLWLDARRDVAESRILSRRDDPSDATVDVLHAQSARDCGIIRWARIDAASDAGVVLERARESIARAHL